MGPVLRSDWAAMSEPSSSLHNAVTGSSGGESARDALQKPSTIETSRPYDDNVMGAIDGQSLPDALQVTISRVLPCPPHDNETVSKSAGNLPLHPSITHALAATSDSQKRAQGVGQSECSTCSLRVDVATNRTWATGYADELEMGSSSTLSDSFTPVVVGRGPDAPPVGMPEDNVAPSLNKLSRPKRSLLTVETDLAPDPDTSCGEAISSKATHEATGDAFPQVRVLYCLQADNPFRRAIQRFLLHWSSSLIMIAVTIANFVCVAVRDPYCDRENCPKSNMLDNIDIAFTAIFTFDLIFQVIAYGAIMHPKAHLRTCSGVFDLIVVILGWLSMGPSFGNLSVLRMVRVLRAVKNLHSYLPTLKTLMHCITEVTSQLLQVGVQVVFFLLIFGIFGVQMYAASLKGRCVDVLTGRTVSSQEAVYPQVMCDYTASDPTSMCSTGFVCVLYVDPVEGFSNPAWGYINFDNILWSFLTVFQVLTMSNWSILMFWLQDVSGFLGAIYMILIIMVGSVLIINVALAVISTKFHELHNGRQRSALEGSAMAALKTLSSKLSSRFPDSVFTPTLSSYSPSIKLPAWARLRRLRPDLYRLATCDTADIVFNVVVVVNYIQVCLVSYNNDSSPLLFYLAIIDWAVSLVLGAWAVLSVLALGPGVYFRSLEHQLEALCVMLSIVEVCISPQLHYVNIFRTLHIFNILRYWDAEYVILYLKIKRCIIGLASFVPVFIIITLTFALLGMQLFGAYFIFSDGTPRINFDTIRSAYLAVFQIILLDNWNEIMFAAMRATGTAACIYFIVVLLMGMFVLINVFTTLVIVNLCNKDDEEINERHKLRSRMNATSRLFQSICARFRRACSLLGKKSPAGAYSTPNEDASRDSGNAASSPEHEKQHHRWEGDHVSPKTLLQRINAAEQQRIKQEASEFLKHSSLFIWGPRSRFRRILCSIVFNYWFDRAVLVMVATSTICLAIDAWNPDSGNVSTLDTIDLVLLVLFSVEMLLKICVMGLVLHPGAYLRDPWCILDGFVVATGVIQLLVESTGGAAVDSLRVLRILRALRCLRPLRMISRMKGLRSVMAGIIASVQAIFRILVVNAVIWGIFACVGVRLFGGKMNYCSDSTIQSKELCVSTTAPGSTYVDRREWLRVNSHFDDWLHALQTLAEISSLDDFSHMVEDGMDTQGRGLAMQTNASPAAFLFYHFFIAVGLFFGLNMIVAVLLKSYSTSRRQEEQEAEDSEALLDEQQQEFRDVLMLVVGSKLRKRLFVPTAFIRLVCFRLVRHAAFESAIMLLVVINVLILAYPSDNSVLLSMFEIVNYIFLAVFLAEATLKLVAYYPKTYFSDSWNIFDFSLVLVGWGAVLLTNFVSLQFSPLYLRIFRLFRLARVLRLAKCFKGLQMVVATLVQSLASLVNVGLLLLIFFFIYGVVGVTQFRHVKSSVFNSHVNFYDLPSALLLLFCLMTGDSWRAYMWECANSQNCATDDDCGTSFAPLYFISFFFLCYLVGLNLFIAIVLDAFGMITDRERYLVNKDMIDELVSLWERLDPHATQCAKATTSIRLLLQMLPYPLGLGADEVIILRFRHPVFSTIPVLNHKVHFVDFATAIVAYVYEKDGVTLRQNIWARVYNAGARNHKALHLQHVEGSGASFFLDEYAANTIQRAFRRRRFRISSLALDDSQWLKVTSNARVQYLDSRWLAACIPGQPKNSSQTQNKYELSPHGPHMAPFDKARTKAKRSLHASGRTSDDGSEEADSCGSELEVEMATLQHGQCSMPRHAPAHTYMAQPCDSTHTAHERPTQVAHQQVRTSGAVAHVTAGAPGHESCVDQGAVMSRRDSCGIARVLSSGKVAIMADEGVDCDAVSHQDVCTPSGQTSCRVVRVLSSGTLEVSSGPDDDSPQWRVKSSQPPKSAAPADISRPNPSLVTRSPPQGSPALALGEASVMAVSGALELADMRVTVLEDEHAPRTSGRGAAGASSHGSRGGVVRVLSSGDVQVVVEDDPICLLTGGAIEVVRVGPAHSHCDGVHTGHDRLQRCAGMRSCGDRCMPSSRDTCARNTRMRDSCMTSRGDNHGLVTVLSGGAMEVMQEALSGTQFQDHDRGFAGMEQDTHGGALSSVRESEGAVSDRSRSRRRRWRSHKGKREVRLEQGMCEVSRGAAARPADQDTHTHSCSGGDVDDLWWAMPPLTASRQSSGRHMKSQQKRQCAPDANQMRGRAVRLASALPCVEMDLLVEEASSEPELWLGRRGQVSMVPTCGPMDQRSSRRAGAAANRSDCDIPNHSPRAPAASELSATDIALLEEELESWTDAELELKPQRRMHANAPISPVKRASMSKMRSGRVDVTPRQQGARSQGRVQKQGSRPACGPRHCDITPHSDAHAVPHLMEELGERGPRTLVALLTGGEFEEILPPTAVVSDQNQGTSNSRSRDCSSWWASSEDDASTALTAGEVTLLGGGNVVSPHVAFTSGVPSDLCQRPRQSACCDLSLPSVGQDTGRAPIAVEVALIEEKGTKISQQTCRAAGPTGVESFVELALGVIKSAMNSPRRPLKEENVSTHGLPSKLRLSSHPLHTAFGTALQVAPRATKSNDVEARRDTVRSSVSLPLECECVGDAPLKGLCDGNSALESTPCRTRCSGPPLAPSELSPVCPQSHEQAKLLQLVVTNATSAPRDVTCTVCSSHVTSSVQNDK